MKKRVLSLLMTFALLLGLLSTTAGAAITLTNDPSLDSNEREILRLTNVYRASKGLPLLSNTANIQKAANQRAQELLTLYSHNRPDGSSWVTALSNYNTLISPYTAAENILKGESTNQAVFNAWVNSANHRANIENAALTHLGVGHVPGYWSQDFVGSTKCVYEGGPSLSTYSITGQVGQSLETLLNSAKLDLYSICKVHGAVTVPVIPAMCSEYDANRVGRQSIRVKWGSKSISVTITLTEAAHTTHTYDNGKVTKAATCTAEGVKTYTCTVCGATKTEAIPKTDHTYNSAGVCTVCGAAKPATGQYSLTVSMTGTGSGSFLLFTDEDTVTGSFPNYQVTAGTKLNLSPGMKRGMQLDTMILRTASGKTQTLINNSTGTALYTESVTCAMPAENATLEISLSPAASHSVNLSTTGTYADQGTLKLLGTSDPNHVTAHLDDFLTVQAQAKTGYLVDTLRVYDVNGNTWDTVTGINQASYSYDFDMLPVNMYFSVSFKPDPNAQQPTQPTQPTTPTGLPFRDVAGHWALEGITYAYEHKLFSGTSDTTFAPEALMNRAMVVTVLARYDGVNTDGGSTWYDKGRTWAMSQGISDGTNMTGSITREQLATMLYRYAGSPAVSGNLQAFPDRAKVSGYASDAMIWAVSKGLISGDNGYLLPQNNATRAQVATIMMRYCEL